jgi:hypothetical protein
MCFPLAGVNEKGIFKITFIMCFLLAGVNEKGIF